jgi:hypothetical protein
MSKFLVGIFLVLMSFVSSSSRQLAELSLDAPKSDGSGDADGGDTGTTAGG